jgi:hypothetical protein
VAPSRGLRVKTRCTTLDQFVSWFQPYCTESSFFLPTSVLSPLGAEVPFSIELADGTPAFAGLGGVLETWPNAANRFGRPGMMIKVRQLTPSSAPMFERIKRANAPAPAPSEFDIPTEISAPAYEAPKRSIQTEDWDLRSAPMEKVEMVDVAGPPAKRRAASVTEKLRPPVVGKVAPPDDPDEAAFTDDDLPTTLVAEGDDIGQRGEDAYVQMAPIADALDISIPADPVILPLPAPAHAEPQPSTIIVDPVIAPGYVEHAPLVEAPISLRPQRRGWLIAIAVIVVIAIGAGLVATFLGR